MKSGCLIPVFRLFHLAIKIFGCVVALPLAAASLSVGDIFVTDAGTSAANTRLWQLPAGATPPITPTDISSQSVGTGSIDFLKISAARSPSILYVYDQTLKCIFQVDPVTGNRSTVSSGTAAPELTGTNTIEMIWDTVGAQLLINYGGTARGIVKVDVTTGTRSYLTGNGVGSGLSPTSNYRGLAVSSAGGIYVYDATNGLLSIDRANGNRSVVSAPSNFTAVASSGGLGYDNFRGLVLVADSGSSAATSAIKWVSPSDGSVTTATGGSSSAAPGSGFALDIPRYPIADASGSLYYRESTGTGSKTIVKVTNPGASNVRSVYSAAANFTSTTGSNLSIIHPTPPSITSSLTASGTYGSAISTYTITASGNPSSYSATGLPSGLLANTTNGQITGTPTTSGTFNVTIGATNSGGTGTATLVFTVAKKILTVSGVTASHKTYNASTAATLGFGSASLVGVVGGDTVSLNTASANGAFSDKNVGTGKTVSVSGLALSGASSGNYTLTQPSTTANITAAGLTVTGVAASGKTYNGTVGATLDVGSAALSGAFGGDSVTLGVGSGVGTFSDKNVGVGKTVTVSGLTISGADAGNYTLTQPITTATISAAGLTVSGVTASSKAYDGTTSATLGFSSASLVGVVSGDTVTLATGSASGAFDNENVGSGKAVTVSGLGLSGTDSGNYSLIQPTATADITAAGLTVSGVTASNKTYDGNASATVGFGSASLVGVVGGDTVTLVTGSASGAFDNENVGTGKTVTVSGLSLSGTDSGNYSLTQPTTTANITAAGLTVSGVTASSKTYDGNTSATLGLGSASLVGVIGGDTVTLVTGSAAGAFADANVSTGKTVTVSGLSLSGTDSGNYSLTQPTTTASITAATLTVTADNKTRAYGFANPTLTASITGFVNSETSAVLSGAPALSTAATAGTTPGAYTITAAIGTLSAGNYTFAFADGTLTVRLQEIADWEEENFTLEELGDPLVSGPDADPDLDGVTNLYEYAFGTDPKDISSGPDPLVYTGTFAGGGTLVEAGQPITRTETIPVNNTRVLFVRRVPSLTSDVTYTPQFSSNGISWVNSSATPTILAEDGLYQVVSVPYPSTTGGKRTRFYRIEADITE